MAKIKKILSSDLSIFLFFFILGIIFRILWLQDMEWKYDEKYMFNEAQKIYSSLLFPPIGMMSGGGIPNPGLGMWFFSLFSSIAATPLGFVGIVSGINILSLGLFALFIIRNFSGNEKKIWLYGLCLACISPLAVLFSRKIWLQDVLPLFCFLVIWSHFHRNKIWGSFFWGLFGALIGQIHMPGFFYAFGLVAFTIFYEFKTQHITKWFFWILGSILGSISLIPWLFNLANTSYAAKGSIGFFNLFRFKFYIYWFLDALGIHFSYSLGRNFYSFLAYPYIFNIPTYLVGLLHGFLLFIGIKLIFNFIKNYKKSSYKKIEPSSFYILAMLLGFGLCVTLLGLKFHVHYLIVAFPFTYISLSKLLHDKGRIFFMVLIAQSLLVFFFLYFIHIEGGAVKGDYGQSYSSQLLIKN